MNDFYFDALQNYLNGSEWRNTMKVFVDAHCMYFVNILDYHPQQVIIWRNFQDAAENILQNALLIVGGSIEDLEEAFDAIQRIPSRSPRDEVIKDILQQLQTFEDFELFSFMMNKAAGEMDLEGDAKFNCGDYDMLMRMGFTVESINKVLDDYEVSNLEDLIIFLSSQEASAGENLSSREITRAATIGIDLSAERKQEDLIEDTLQILPMTPYEKFAIEAQSDEVIMDGNQVSAFFLVAESILSAYDSGEWLASDEFMKLAVEWSKQVDLLKTDLLLSYEQKLPCKSVVVHHPSGLIAWFMELEEQRQVLQTTVVSGSGSKLAKQILSDEELSRMSELEKLAALGTKDEQKLHSLLTHHEVLTGKIKHLYSQCNILLSMNSSLLQHRNLIEEVYFYLKETLNKRTTNSFEVKENDNLQSTVDVGEDVWSNANVQELLHREYGSELMDILLELHLLEDELVYINQEIQRLLDLTMGGSASQMHSDNSDGKSSGFLFDSSSNNESFESKVSDSTRVADAKQPTNYNSAIVVPHSSELKADAIDLRDMNLEEKRAETGPMTALRDALHTEQPFLSSNFSPTRSLPKLLSSPIKSSPALPPIKFPNHNPSALRLFPNDRIDPTLSAYSSKEIIEHYKDEQAKLLNLHMHKKELAYQQLMARLQRKKRDPSSSAEDQIAAEPEIQAAMLKIEEEFEANCSSSFNALRDRFAGNVLEGKVDDSHAREHLKDLKELYLLSTENLTKNILAQKREDSMKKWRDRLTKRQRFGADVDTEEGKSTDDEQVLWDEIKALDTKFMESLNSDTSVGAAQSDDHFEDVKSSILQIFVNEKAHYHVNEKPEEKFESENYEKLISQMKNLHFEKQNILVDSLQSNMLETRAKLEHRIAQKRRQLHSQSQVNAGRATRGQGEGKFEVETDEREEEILSLQAQVSSLHSLYEQAKQLLDDEKKQALIASTSFSHASTEQNHALDNELLRDRVKQLTNNYTEEQQKLDLCMKIQQTRQRQLLQRKLLEKKAAQVSAVAEEKGLPLPPPKSFSGADDSKRNQRNVKEMMSRGMDLKNLMRK